MCQEIEYVYGTTINILYKQNIATQINNLSTTKFIMKPIRMPYQIRFFRK